MMPTSESVHAPVLAYQDLNPLIDNLLHCQLKQYHHRCDHMRSLCSRCDRAQAWA